MNVELLQKVKQQILAEPHRFNMLKWIGNRDNEEFYSTDNFYHYCGTTACIAGWTVLLSTKDRLVHYEIFDRALQFLDISFDEAEKLFYAHSWDREDFCEYDAADIIGKSIVAARVIDKFIAQHG